MQSRASIVCILFYIPNFFDTHRPPFDVFDCNKLRFVFDIFGLFFILLEIISSRYACHHLIYECARIRHLYVINV